MGILPQLLLSLAACAVEGVTAPNATVTAHRLGSPSPVNGVSASAAGRFCLPALADGEYSIRALAASKLAASADPACLDCCARAATVPGPAWSVPVLVRKGRAPQSMRLMPKPVPAFCLRGEVRDQNGALATEAAVALEAVELQTGATVLSKGGRFLVTGLPEGHYRLIVSAGSGDRYAPPLAMETVEIRDAHVERVVRVRWK